MGIPRAVKSANQRRRRALYRALKAQGLPLPTRHRNPKPRPVGCWAPTTPARATHLPCYVPPKGLIAWTLLGASIVAPLR